MIYEPIGTTIICCYDKPDSIPLGFIRILGSIVEFVEYEKVTPDQGREIQQMINKIKQNRR